MSMDVEFPLVPTPYRFCGAPLARADPDDRT